MGTRFSAATAQASSADYKNLIDGLTAAAPGPGYCDATPAAYDGLSNQVTCGGTESDIAFHFQVTFQVSPGNAGAWDFRIGPDFRHGGTAILDGSTSVFKTVDLWWDGSYADPAQLLELSGIVLTPGIHVLDVYGLEGCCDGAQQGQFRAPGGEFTSFSTADGLSVPEPATIALLGIGLAGLRLRRRGAA